MTAEQILDMLMSQTFVDFNNGALANYIDGEEDAMTRTEILKEIEEMMPFLWVCLREREDESRDH